MRLKDKRAVVLGGTSGIGFEVARSLTAEGARVTIAGRNEERARAAAERLGDRVEGVSVDVTDEPRVEEFFAQVGAFDHLICTASGVALGPVVGSPSAPARALVESKLWGQYYAVKHGAPRLGRGSSITLFSGTVSQRPMEGAAAYAAAGAAVEALTRVLALELRPVRVNTVVPGVVDTAAWDALLSKEDKAALFAATAGSLPVGRIGRPEEIASAVVFLVKNGFVNGTTLVVDGGHRVV